MASLNDIMSLNDPTAIQIMRMVHKLYNEKGAVKNLFDQYMPSTK